MSDACDKTRDKMMGWALFALLTGAGMTAWALFWAKDVRYFGLIEWLVLFVEGWILAIVVNAFVLVPVAKLVKKQSTADSHR